MDRSTKAALSTYTLSRLRSLSLSRSRSLALSLSLSRYLKYKQAPGAKRTALVKEQTKKNSG